VNVVRHDAVSVDIDMVYPADAGGNGGYLGSGPLVAKMYIRFSAHEHENYVVGYAIHISMHAMRMVSSLVFIVHAMQLFPPSNWYPRHIQRLGRMVWPSLPQSPA